MATKFEMLCVDMILEIFQYLEPHELIHSFSSLNARLSEILLRCPLRASIGGTSENVECYMQFVNACRALTHRALGCGTRLISLRISLVRAIGGWSLLAPIFHRQRCLLMLRRIHLIDVRRYEFDRLLNALTGAPVLDTLLFDWSGHSCENMGVMHTFETMGDGAYLAEVCARLPALAICRLPSRLSLKATSPSSIPNRTTTTHLRTLHIFNLSVNYLQRLLSTGCIPYIKRLHVFINDHNNSISNFPAAVDVNLVSCLTHLHLQVSGNLCFYQTIALLSRVFGQLVYLFLELNGFVTSAEEYPDQTTITAQIIEQRCLERLRSDATYGLNLLIRTQNDRRHRTIFKSFLEASFVRESGKSGRPPVVVQEHSWNPFLVHTSPDPSRFSIYTVPLRRKSCFSWELPDQQISSWSGSTMYPCVKEFHFDDHERDLSLIENDWWCLRSVSYLQIASSSNLNVATISNERLLLFARLPHVHSFSLANKAFLMLASHSSTATVLNRQMSSLHLANWLRPSNCADSDNILTLLVSGLLPNLRYLSFDLDIVKSSAAARVTTIVHMLVDSLPKLTYLTILVFPELELKSHCLAHQIRHRFFVNWPLALRRYHRLRCLDNLIQIWF